MQKNTVCKQRLELVNFNKWFKRVRHTIEANGIEIYKIVFILKTDNAKKYKVSKDFFVKSNISNFMFDKQHFISDERRSGSCEIRFVRIPNTENVYYVT